jgi:DNA-binding HxlR family transcriptional regulator
MISSPHLSQVLRDLQRKDTVNRSAEHPRSPWRMPYPNARNGRVTVKMHCL